MDDGHKRWKDGENGVAVAVEVVVREMFACRVFRDRKKKERKTIKNWIF